MEMVVNAPKVQEVMPKLIEFVGDNPIVAHNASFDVGFLQHYSNNSFSQNKVIDTVVLSRRMNPFLPNHKLGTVAKYMGITDDGFHRAEFDCECCAQIYMKYIGVAWNKRKRGEEMIALVTGASSGIGKDMAIYLSQLGYDILAIGRDKSKLDELKMK